ncbi:MAG: LysM peptidoglycan-binding domain-containing protein, partial [Treponemataceae bacterium]|nr:LysM peptidoglycan-binding domain-containing protein [Treponemataceae bacterium]
VTVSGQVSLERLASELRLDYPTLRLLNRALVKSCTPPHAEYAVRLPAGMERAATIALRSIIAPPAPQKPAAKTEAAVIAHTVAKGETLFFLSRQYGCSVDAICAANNIRREDVLAVGKVLYIPAKHAET